MEQALIQPRTHFKQTDAPSLRHWAGWVDPATANSWFSELERESPWKQESIALFGKRHLLPRLTCWMADPGCGYRYSGLENIVEPWSPTAQLIRNQVSQHTGWCFNSLLLNLYRNGKDAMGFHADNEPELDPKAPIASLSFGASRTLRFKPQRGIQGESMSLELGNGDLLLMDPPTQQEWLHGVPRRLRVAEARLNLTFRVVSKQ